MKPKRRYLQFSLLTLFVIVTVVAAGSHWFAARRRAEAAEEEYQYVKAGLYAGTKTKEDIYRASIDWLNAELAVPFCKPDELYKAHRARMTTLEEWCQGNAHLGLFGSEAGKRDAEREAAKSTEWRREAEQWVKENAKP
ncbi:MAG TPA: hypothetical protein VMV10_12245 [Pirellulales bacterium]|nr:hypothetical protein [Pirellulales bacterium]